MPPLCILIFSGHFKLLLLLVWLTIGVRDIPLMNDNLFCLGFRVFPGVVIKGASPFCSTILYETNSYMCDVRMGVEFSSL